METLSNVLHRCKDLEEDMIYEEVSKYIEKVIDEQILHCGNTIWSIRDAEIIRAMVMNAQRVDIEEF